MKEIERSLYLPYFLQNEESFISEMKQVYYKRGSMS